MARHAVVIFECDYCGKRTKPMTDMPKSWKRLHGKWEVCKEHRNIDPLDLARKILREV